MVSEHSDLQVSLVRSGKDSADVRWTQLTDLSLVSCDGVYGINNTDKKSMQSLPLQGNSVNIPGLHVNQTYNFYIVCNDVTDAQHRSNIITFTTDKVRDYSTHLNSVASGESVSDVKIAESRGHAGDVALGIICGVIAFITITVLVIVVIRKFHRHRRRNIWNTDQDTDQFAYLPDDI